jgi:hypothetical protein
MAYTMNMASEAQNQNLEYVCAVARNLDNRLAPMRANKRSGDHHKESLDNKKSKVSVGNSSYFPGGADASKLLCLVIRTRKDCFVPSTEQQRTTLKTVRLLN